GRLRLRGGGQRKEDDQMQGACYCLMRFAVHSICPIPATSAFPFTMASPSRSPVSTTVIGPCGVCAVIVTFIALPSMVPSTGTSPIWLPKVPVSLPPSTLRFAFAGKSPAGVLSVTSHLPPKPVKVVVVAEAAAAAASAGAVVAAGAAAAVASDRFAVQSP